MKSSLQKAEKIFRQDCTNRLSLKNEMSAEIPDHLARQTDNEKRGSGSTHKNKKLHTVIVHDDIVVNGHDERHKTHG